MSLAVLTPLLALAIVLAGCGGTPSEKPASKTTTSASSTETADEPAVPEPAGDAAALNAASIEGFERIFAALEQVHATGATYPLNAILLESELLGGDVPDNPHKGRDMHPDHSFLGLDPGDYSYTQILMPDGVQAGFVLFGYGDTGMEGPPEEVVETFFTARNWVGWNKASTDPRLPNDVPEKAIYGRLVLKEGIGTTPPPDFEEPPQESLVGN